MDRLLSEAKQTRHPLLPFTLALSRVLLPLHMPRSIRLTQATRANLLSTGRFNPHQILLVEQQTLKNRLANAFDHRDRLLAEIELASGQKECKQLIKSDLPKANRLIERIKNELQRIETEIQLCQPGSSSD